MCYELALVTPRSLIPEDLTLLKTLLQRSWKLSWLTFCQIIFSLSTVNSPWSPDVLDCLALSGLGGICFGLFIMVLTY